LIDEAVRDPKRPVSEPLSHEIETRSPRDSGPRQRETDALEAALSKLATAKLDRPAGRTAVRRVVGSRERQARYILAPALAREPGSPALGERAVRPAPELLERPVLVRVEPTTTRCGSAVVQPAEAVYRTRGLSDSLGEPARFPSHPKEGTALFAFRLELTDGAAADPPTFRTSVRTGRPIPLGRDRVLRVIEVRPGAQADDERSVLVVEDMA
jgi:hypothetical protein